ncbi:Trpm2 [Symbiodinium necroappetens]|uniref:Trpm2 protein n=1 Tax=Symbiodinium necroappetens TaxID=1628268 RepID=A0A812JEV4_9DINO|nr:Trpm2 [Symbiodinium necroappetens]
MDWPLERNGRDLFAREPPLRELLKLSAPSNLSARNMEDALVRVISKHSLYPIYLLQTLVSLRGERWRTDGSAVSCRKSRMESWPSLLACLHPSTRRRSATETSVDTPSNDEKLFKKSATDHLDSKTTRARTFTEGCGIPHATSLPAESTGDKDLPPETTGVARKFRSAVSRVALAVRPTLIRTRVAEDVAQATSECDKDLEASLMPPGRTRPGIAEIAFDSGSSQYCLISHAAFPEQMLERIVKPEWGLRNPNLILSIMGGAGNMNLPPDKFDLEGFSQGLVEAATRTSGWVITGGTASGVMDIVGKAMQRHDKQRQVPCLGITPYGALTCKWRDLINSAYDPDFSAVTKVDAAAAKPAEGAPPETDGNIPLAALQDNHSHFIICDNGEVGSKAFGTEIQFRTKFEEFVTRGVNAGGLRTRVPRVMILVNGGKISLISLVQAINTGCPLVVCRGTGRIADVICRILEKPCVAETDDEIDEESGSEKDEDAQFRQALDLAVKEFMPKDTLSPEDVANFQTIVRSQMVEIYTINDRFEDVVLRAVLGNAIAMCASRSRENVGVWQQLSLAVQWGCEGYYDRLGQRLVQERGGSERGPEAAIRLIFKELVGFGSRDAKTPITLVRSVRENAGVLVTWLLQHYLKQMDQFEVNCDTLPPEKEGKPCVHWSRLGFQESWKSLEGLLLWSIEKEAPSSVLETIWSYMEDPVHAALVAASACRDTAEREHFYASYQDGLAKKELDDAADRFERLACLVLEDLALSGKGVDYLFRESARWQVRGEGRTCFQLAHALGCKAFVSATFYRLAVDLYWMTPVPFQINKKQLDAQFLRWWPFLSLLWNFKACGFPLWEFLSIPSIQAWTHGLARAIFVGLYSYAVFYRLLTFSGVSLVEVLLFLWGLGLGQVEIKQLQNNGFQAYIHDFWNFLDSLHITVLLGCLVLGVLLTDKNEEMNEVEHLLEVTHAMNLLPCWIRVLQILQQSEYFGTLLLTIFGMAKDAVKFFILVVIFCFGFSCAITPILFTQSAERDEQGLTWAFWTIVGNLDDKALNKLDSLTPVTRFIANILVYTLALVCNVLLVNLLIAVMNSTYEQNQAVSQTSWAFFRVEAVLEFDHESILPPPLNLLEPFLNRQASSGQDQQQLGRRRSEQRMHAEMSITRRDLKDAQQRAFRAINLEEDMGESASLRAELAELRIRNQELAQRNRDLEGLAASYLLERPAPSADLQIPVPSSPNAGVLRRNRRLSTVVSQGLAAADSGDSPTHRTRSLWAPVMSRSLSGASQTLGQRSLSHIR